MPEENTETLSDCLFDSKDIEGIITKLNDNKSTYFSPKVLKLISSKLSPQLVKIFNVCMKDGYFPNELKIAKVIPLYKHKGSINDICNYRPISMLSVFSKIFEKLIHKEIMSFLDANSTLSDCQFGFRAKHSTAHALINAISHLQLAMDSGKSALGLFIDFSKAFDTINHRILLDKLEIYGIRGNLHKVLSSYLAERYQYVSYGQISSSLLKLTCGVPQGSVLGPLLFIIFINDIHNASTLAKCILFADDLNIFLENTDRDVLYEQANAVLSDIYEYCKANLLIVNFDKCCFVEFSKNHVYNLPHPKIVVGVRFFKKVECCKFLGVHINKDLKWDDHIETWLTKEHLDNEIFPNDTYRCFRLDRTAKSHPPDERNKKKFKEKGGGILIAVRSDLDVEPRLVNINCKAEIASVELNFKKNKEIVCITLCYRVGTLP